MADTLPIVTLVRNGADTVEAVTVSLLPDLGYLASASIPSGWAAGDTLYLRIFADCDGQMQKAVKRLGPIMDPLTDVRSLLAAAAADAETSRKILCNRMEMTGLNTPAAALVLYDDDGVTPFKTWPLSTFGGEDVQACVGAQTARGVPT